MTLSPLDQALALRIAKKQDDALRAAIAMLEGQPDQVGAAWLIGRILVDRKRPLVAGEAAARLVDAYVRRGDLPAATLCAHLANDAGDPAGPLFEAIAKAFGKGSARLQEIAPAPPPLPKAPAIAADLKIASGDALLSRAERALTSFLASEDETDINAPLPTLPLFSSLEPKALAQLLGATGVREIAEKDFILQHGEEGSEAFVVVRGLFHAVREDVTLAALGAGGFFGEMALVSDAPRAASVQAKEPSVVLVIGRRVLENLAARVPAIGVELGAFCQQRMIGNLLRHSAILGAVDPKERPALMARFTTRAFKTGEALVKRDEETRGLYLIASGAVIVASPDADGDRVILAQLGPGDVVGEISLVLRRPATADVTASHPTIALELTREQFQEAIREHPTLLRELYTLATQREDETRTVVAQEALELGDDVLL